MKKLLAILVITAIVTPSLQTVISCDFNLKQDLPEIDPISLFAGKQVKDLKDVVYEKISKVSGIDKDIIKADSNLKITINEIDNILVEEEILFAGEYKIIIKALENDKYFIGQRTVNLRIDKQNLPKIDTISLVAGKKDEDLFNKVYKELADASGLTEKQIQDDKNLTITIKKGETPVEPNTSLKAGNYIITIKANKDDQYFTGEANIDLNVTKFDLATADLTIENFMFDINCHTYLNLFNKVFNKLSELSGLINSEIWDHSENLGNDFLIVTDALGNEWGYDERDDFLTVQTYTITFKALENDEYFTGEANIDVNVEKFDLATADLTIESFDANGYTYLNLFNKVFDKVAERSGLLNQDLWKHSEDLKNDFLIITDSLGNKHGYNERNSPLTPETYTITLKALDNDKYFIGTKSYTVKLT